MLGTIVNTSSTYSSNNKTFSNCLSILYQNTRGLGTKTDLIYEFSTTCIFDVVAISETWLRPDIDDSELFSSDFVVFRKDRDFGRSVKSRGGGVLLAVKKSLSATLINLKGPLFVSLTEIDIIAVKLSNFNIPIYIFVLYIPPGTASGTFYDFVDAIFSLEFIFRSKVILVGDFNVPEYRNSLETGNSLGNTVPLLHLLETLELSQLNNILNAHNRLLDLVASNMSCTVTRSDEYLVPEDQYHPTLLINVNNIAGRQSYIKGVVPTDSYNFRNVNIGLLTEGISNIDWSTLYNITNANLACQEFYGNLYEIFTMMVPTNKPRKHKYPPWFTVEIIKEIKMKAKFWKAYKRDGNNKDYEEFRILRRRIKLKVKTLYKDYIAMVEEQISNDPKKFWQFVKIKKSGTDIPLNMIVNDMNISGPTNIVEAFANVFRAAYNLSSDKVSTQEYISVRPDVSLFPVSEQEVFEAINKLKSKFTAGPDKIPSIIIRECASVLVAPLTFLINLCLKSATFPDEWKKSKIVPIFKSGDKNIVENYRPVALMNNFAKVFEFIIYKQMIFQLKNSLTEVQHGFVPGRSTVTNLCEITQFISSATDSNCQTDVIYLDCSKAFDRLDHRILLSKLDVIGCTPKLLKFFSSYLSERKCFVLVHGYISEEFEAVSGVPQGSVLGPLLFNVFINDIVNGLNVQCSLYADDLKIYSKIHSVEDCENLQKNLEATVNWCQANKMPINRKKCVTMTFGLKKNEILFNYKIGEVLLSRPEIVSDLGVIFDKKLLFSRHIETTVSKSLKTYGYIVRNSKDFKNNSTLLRIFNSLVRSQLEYASVVWFPHYSNYRQNLERVVRRFFKYLCYRNDGVYPVQGYSHTRLLERFSAQSLTDRNKRARVIFLHKLINSIFDCPRVLAQLNFHISARPYHTRCKNLFYVYVSRTDVLKYSPLYTMCELGNHVHNELDLFHCTIRELKKSEFAE